MADADFTIQASISSTDAAGNVGTGTGTESYTVDVTSSPTITLTSNITADDVINAAEAAGTVSITGTVGGEANVGDTVTLTVNGNTYTGTVAAGNTFSIDVAGADLAATTLVLASITSTDAAGNVGTAGDTESYTVDVTAPAPTITLTSNITADDIINAAEAGGPWRSPARSAATPQIGDIVTLTVNGTDLHRHGRRGQRLHHRRAGRATWWPTPTSPSTPRQHHRRGRQRRHGDGDTESYTVDVTVARATIALDRQHHGRRHHQRGGGRRHRRDHRHGRRRRAGRRHRHADGQRHGLYRHGRGRHLLASTSPGATLVADADFTIDASVSTTRAAGNSGTRQRHRELHGGRDRAGADGDAERSIITADDIINAAEAGGTVAITGTVGGDAAPGDTVTLTVNGNAYTGTVAAGNSFTINVAGADLAADADFTVDASSAPPTRRATSAPRRRPSATRST